MLTVIWDVDDVLNDLMHSWFNHEWMEKHPECGLSYADLTSNPPLGALRVKQAEYLASIDSFRQTERARNMSPNPELLQWFREQGQRFRHIALTARPLESAPDVAQWVMHHFGAWIRCFGVVPTRTDSCTPVYDQNKGSFLAWFGRGDVLVDDGSENIAQADSLGMKTLMVSQPWNNSQLSIPELLSELSKMADD